MNENLLSIDGSQGEGGGQILRSSLALSLATGRAFVIDNIRANRRKPGLMRQHLAAARAAAEVGQAAMQGAELGSRRLIFKPSQVKAGRHVFRVGTAGSATLVLQTVLPALLTAKHESNLTLEGGTHNPLAPPFDFLEKAFLPLVNRMGPRVEAKLVRPGFYPAGGGRLTVHMSPSDALSQLQLLDRGKVSMRRVRALVANLPRHIAERECRVIAEKSGWDKRCFTVEEVANATGPGNVVLIELESDHVTEVFTGFGRKGVRAEKVAMEACRDAHAYLESGVPVGIHLADQLMLPLAIGRHLGSGGGTFRTHDLSPHSTTHLEVIRQFLDMPIHVNHEESGGVTVTL
ncbi:MAG: RNA 3'-terminal phosphate cyclase [Planctomycetota bacterium]